MADYHTTVPTHFIGDNVGEVWKVSYQERAKEARIWADQNNIEASSNDKFRVCLLLIDIQNTFCIPEFELFVAGRSGVGAIEDNRRLCEFIYLNCKLITQICPTMDTHQAIQIFHSIFFVDSDGKYPEPFTLISADDVAKGLWRINPKIIEALEIEKDYSENYLNHYTQSLKQDGKYNLTVWPYHAMLGGIGHALVAAIEEAIFFHSIARFSPIDFITSRLNPLTENYSVIKPEVMLDQTGSQISPKDTKILDKLVEFDAVVIAGQAKSHCVAWTIDDLHKELCTIDTSLVRKIYLLEDCTSPVVIPDVIDYTDQADEAYERFRDLGMNVINSTQSLADLPGFRS